MAQSPLSATDINRGFLDSFLEYRIGQYFTPAKFLSSRASEQISDAERLSVGIEVSALARASLESLVAWFHALRRWNVGGIARSSSKSSIASACRTPTAGKSSPTRGTSGRTSSPTAWGFPGRGKTCGRDTSTRRTGGTQ